MTETSVEFVTSTSYSIYFYKYVFSTCTGEDIGMKLDETTKRPFVLQKVIDRPASNQNTEHDNKRFKETAGNCPSRARRHS